MNRQVAADTAGAAQSCAHRLLEILAKAIESSGRATLAVSGGSTPKLMFAEMTRNPIAWDKVHLFWVDERAVPMTSDDSNYKLANDNFIEPAAFPKRNIHRIHGEIDPDQAVKRYRDEIEEFFQLEHGHFPKFDAIHLGMGEEGHTASLFPCDAHIEDRTGLAVAVFAPEAAALACDDAAGIAVGGRAYAHVSRGRGQESGDQTSGRRRVRSVEISCAVDRPGRQECRVVSGSGGRRWNLKHEHYPAYFAVAAFGTAGPGRSPTASSERAGTA